MVCPARQVVRLLPLPCPPLRRETPRTHRPHPRRWTLSDPCQGRAPTGRRATRAGRGAWGDSGGHVGLSGGKHRPDHLADHLCVSPWQGGKHLMFRRCHDTSDVRGTDFLAGPVRGVRGSTAHILDGRQGPPFPTRRAGAPYDITSRARALARRHPPGAGALVAQPSSSHRSPLQSSGGRGRARYGGA